MELRGHVMRLCGVFEVHVLCTMYIYPPVRHPELTFLGDDRKFCPAVTITIACVKMGKTVCAVVFGNMM